jgi:parallel beta-helix repeat protein
MKRLMAIALAIVLLAAIVVATPVAAQAEWHVYPGDSIQAAVDLATPGDMVIVHAGEYHQSVVFGPEDSGITLSGDGAVLDGDTPADPGTNLTVNGISLSAGVTIEGFEIRNYRIGIQGWPTTGNLIKGNEISDNEWGISLYLANDNIIMDNEVSGSAHQGILVAIGGSTGNLIKGNEVSDNAWGIQLQYANDNIIIDNEVIGSVHGILVLQSTDNLIKGNEVYGDVSGIRLYLATDNEVIDNEVIGSTNEGITVIVSTGNLIKENEVSGSGLFDLYDSSAPPPLDNTWQENIYRTANF